MEQRDTTGPNWNFLNVLFCLTNIARPLRRTPTPLDSTERRDIISPQEKSTPYLQPPWGGGVHLPLPIPKQTCPEAIPLRRKPFCCRKRPRTHSPQDVLLSKERETEHTWTGALASRPLLARDRHCYVLCTAT